MTITKDEIFQGLKRMMATTCPICKQELMSEVEKRHQQCWVCTRLEVSAKQGVED